MQRYARVLEHEIAIVGIVQALTVCLCVCACVCLCVRVCVCVCMCDRESSASPVLLLGSV